MMRTQAKLVWILPLLVLSACQAHDAQRARYEAERARYWAERGDIRFSLENSPRVREGKVASGARHETVAVIADPSAFGSELDESLRSDLEELRAQALVRAGRAYLEGGEFDRAVPLLDHARRSPVFGRALDAGWLLTQAQLERPDLAEASSVARDLFDRLIRDGGEEPPAARVLELPSILVQAFDAESDSGGVREVEAWARPALVEISRRWPESRVAGRARFLLHRLALAMGDVDQALADLVGFEASTTDSSEIARSQLVRAEILAVERADVPAARALYEGVRKDAREASLRGLARLRLIDLLIVEGNVAAAADSLLRFSRTTQMSSTLLSAAELRLAELQREEGDTASAIQAYRRLILRFPDTMAAVVAPLEVVEIQREQGDRTPQQVKRAEEFALRQAVEQYRRVLASHPGDSSLGRIARRNLVHVLRQTGDAQGALLEAEQLYHSVGPTHTGMEALLLAARVAAEDLDQRNLALAYLARVEEIWPGSEEARRAAGHRTSLEAGGGFDP